MQLRRIVICLEEQRRVILYPEGGLEIEVNVLGPGWVIENDADDPNGPGDDDIVALLAQAREVLDLQLTKLPPAPTLPQPDKDVPEWESPLFQALDDLVGHCADTGADGSAAWARAKRELSFVRNARDAGN